MDIKNLPGIRLSIVMAITILYAFCTFNYVDAIVFNNDSTNVQGNENAQIDDRNLTIEGKNPEPADVTSEENMYSNPNFMMLDNHTGFVSLGLSTFWKNQFESCSPNFKCSANFSTGWKDDISFQMATKNNTKSSWSILYGDEIDVNPIDSYEVVTHMKLNRWAMQSHAKVEGYNESSKEWYQIKQCPSGTNGPIEWREFNCVITIPQGTTKIRPVLTAGWSSQDNQWAITWFDSIYIIKLNPFIADPNLKADIAYQGLDVPNFMTFVGPKDYLVSEKDKGTIQRITNGTKSNGPLLDLAVTRHDGLLGIVTQKNLSAPRQQNVYLFVTEAERDGKDLVAKKPIGNRILDMNL